LVAPYLSVITRRQTLPVWNGLVQQIEVNFPAFSDTK
jgi:hypothetical protein